jgi:hypothetical protein
MFLGRMVGWVLIAVATVMASADAVLALGSGDRLSIATSDVWTLLAGNTSFGWAGPLMRWPVWTLLGPLGVVMLLSCRPRRRRRYRFRTMR